MLRSAKCVANRAAELAKAGTRKHASMQLTRKLGGKWSAPPQSHSNRPNWTLGVALLRGGRGVRLCPRRLASKQEREGKSALHGYNDHDDDDDANDEEDDDGDHW